MVTLMSTNLALIPDLLKIYMNLNFYANKTPILDNLNGQQTCASSMHDKRFLIYPKTNTPITSQLRLLQTQPF